MASLRLFNLPREIILQILNRLSRCDLLSLSLVNNTTCAATEPVLWSDIALVCRPRHPPSIDLLLQTLFKKQHLLEYTIHLAFKSFGFAQNFHPGHIPRFPVESLPQDVAASFIQCTTLGPALKDTWIQELKLATLDALVTLVVALLPNLTFLRLTHRFTPYTAILGQLLRHQLCQDQPIPHEIKLLILSKSLRQVDFLTSNQYYRNSPDILPFLHLPSLEHISIGIANRFAFLFPVEMPSLKSLVSLKLKGIRESSLQYILKPLENPQALSWQFYTDGTYSPSEGFIDLEVMGAALRSISKTVTYLNISETDEFDDNIFDGPQLSIQSSLDGLKEFDRLKELIIPWIFLMGFKPGRGESCYIVCLVTLHAENE